MNQITKSITVTKKYFYPIYKKEKTFTSSLSVTLDCFCDKTTAFQYFKHGVSCIEGCEEGHPVFNG